MVSPYGIREQQAGRQVTSADALVAKAAPYITNSIGQRMVIGDDSANHVNGQRQLLYY